MTGRVGRWNRARAACWRSASSRSSASSTRGTSSASATPPASEFARGLTNYATSDARRIRGLRTQQAREALGSALYDEVVHRDNLVLIV